MIGLRNSLVNYLTLFGSISTLVCCALPVLLISLGLGAVMAGLASNVPGLVWLSENKTGLFLFAGIMLAFNGYLLWRSRNEPCPTDPQLRSACLNGRRTSKVFYFASLAIFSVGAFFAYGLTQLKLF